MRREVLSVDWKPYEPVDPYSTCESADLFVVQVIVAEEEVIEFAKTDEITGGVLSTPIMVRVKVVVFAAPPVAVPVTVIV